MKKSELEKNEKELEQLPLASMVIEEYKSINQSLKDTNKKVSDTNKRLTIIIGILLVLFAIETTYIILYWDSMHPNAGAIREHNSE